MALVSLYDLSWMPTGKAFILSATEHMLYMQLEYTVCLHVNFAGSFPRQSQKVIALSRKAQ